VYKNSNIPLYEIVKMASKIGLDSIAILDHDSIDAVEEGQKWGKHYNLNVIPACEIFGQHQGRFLHLLGYYIDHRNSDLVNLCKTVEEDRINGIDNQIKILREGGFYLEKEDVLKYCGKSLPLYSSYARAIFEDERNNNNNVLNEYKKKDGGNILFCMEQMAIGKKYYIPQYIPEAKVVINAIEKAGGVAVLAHPGANLKEDENNVIESLIDLGLVGLEVYTSHHNINKEQFYAKVCRDYNLIYTCGSDFHGKFKPNVKLGGVKNNTLEVLENLKASWEQKHKSAV
jgi:predicted metal-dependent phosphoesterase TrpH